MVPIISSSDVLFNEVALLINSSLNILNHSLPSLSLLDRALGFDRLSGALLFND